MTKRVGDVLVIEREEPQQCDGCGKIAELRPYGPGGSMICFECGMKDEAATKARFAAVLDGVSTVDLSKVQLRGGPQS